VTGPHRDNSSPQRKRPGCCSTLVASQRSVYSGSVWLIATKDSNERRMFNTTATVVFCPQSQSYPDAVHTPCEPRIAQQISRY
jgi:hypothetical protein